MAWLGGPRAGKGAEHKVALCRVVAVSARRRELLRRAQRDRGIRRRDRNRNQPSRVRRTCGLL